MFFSPHPIIFRRSLSHGGKSQRYIIILTYFPLLGKRKGAKARTKKQIKIAIYNAGLFVYNSKV
jgi:hypothetical protein